MYYNEFKERKLSALGYGTMRLPVLSGPADINQELVNEIVDYAIENGVNYFDTAYIYHDNMGEGAIGKALARYPRDSWYLADKYPGHQVMSNYDCDAIFHEQLRRCGVEYFDFYLLHNVNEFSLRNYLNPELGIKEYFVKAREEGRIKHFGFSCHGDCQCIEQFLAAYGDVVEFCQIQLNYLDWTLQDAKAKYELLTERGIPIWVMEPCRGGKLVNIPDSAAQKLKAIKPEASIPSWAFRFLQGLPNVKMILSGMNSMEQIIDNVQTFGERQPLTEDEKAILFEAAEEMKNAIPCTGCRYCCHGCPKQIDIPRLIALYNDYRLYPSLNINMRIAGMEVMPDECIGCGQCSSVCPQGIDIPKYMREMAEAFSSLASWADICREREEALNKG